MSVASLKVVGASHPVAAVALFAGAGVVAGLGAATNPGVLLAAIIAIPLCVGAVLHTKAAFWLGAGAVAFSPMLQAVPLASSVDEAIVLLLLAATAWHLVGGNRAVRTPPGFWAVSAFALLTAVSTTYASPQIAALDAFLLLKGFALYFCAYQFSWSERDVREIARWGAWAAAVAIGLMLVSAVVGQPWTEAFSVTGGSITRGGFSSPLGPFGHPGAAAQAMTLILTAALAYRLAFGRSRVAVALIVGALPFVFLSLRRKAIASVLVASASTLTAASRATRRTVALAAIILVPILTIATASVVLEVVQATQAEYGNSSKPPARTALYQGSVRLANDRFPGGGGFGSFGTPVAFDNYSPVYYAYGFDSIYGLEPRIGNFASDTFWPAVIGQAGWLGLPLFLGAVFAIARRALQVTRRGQRERSPELRFAGAVGVAWSLDFLIESVAQPTYSAPPLFALFFVAMGTVAALLHRPTDSQSEARYRELTGATGNE